MNDVTLIDKCRLCECSELNQFIHFNNVPLANCYSEDGKKVPRYDLTVVRCKNCGSYQLKQDIDPSILFSKYSYSTPPSLSGHFEEFAGSIIRDLNLSDKSIIVDIGGNNGLLLSYFKQLTDNVVNIEPAENIAKESRKRGINTINKFFNTDFLDFSEYFKNENYADVIISSNVFAHSPDILDMMRRVKTLLKKGGVFIQENAYWIDTLRNNDYFQIYFEHFFYHTISSLSKIYRSLGMTLYKVTFNKTSQMGSFRAYVKNYPNYPVEESTANIIKEEERYLNSEIKIDCVDSNYYFYKNFETPISTIKRQIVDFLEQNKDKRIGLVGVPAKAALMIDNFDLEKYISFAYEDASLKIGKQVPGTNIIIKPMDELIECDILILGAYNFSSHLIERFKYLDKIWCVPLPKFSIIKN